MRRAGAMTAPVGNWCAGVTTIADPLSSRRRLVRMPSASTGHGSTRRPEARTVDHSSARDGDSKAMLVAPRPTSAADQVERLCESLRHHDPLGRDAHAADPSEMAAQRPPQLDPSAVVAVVERVVRRVAERALAGPKPGAAREELDIGRGRHEVEAPRRPSRLRSGRGFRCDAGDDRCLSRDDLEVTLGRELVIRIGDDAA